MSDVGLYATRCTAPVCYGPLSVRPSVTSQCIETAEYHHATDATSAQEPLSTDTRGLGKIPLGQHPTAQRKDIWKATRKS